MKKEDIKGVQAVLIGALPGKRLVILAGVHGNETCGIQAFERVIPNIEIARGTVTLVLGNPAAIEKNVRFVDANLNRMFRPDEELSKAMCSTHEYRRSRELMPLLMEADAVLDIHSSGTRDTIPFAIASHKSLASAEALGFPLVSYGWDSIEPGGTDDFAERYGAEGICIECGHHEDPEATELAERSIYRFLALQGATDVAGTWTPPAPERRVRVNNVYKTMHDFSPAQMYRDFAPVQKGDIIGTDNGLAVNVPEDGVVIFVRERKGPGEEAFIFGTMVSL